MVGVDRGEGHKESVWFVDCLGRLWFCWERRGSGSLWVRREVVMEAMADSDMVQRWHRLGSLHDGEWFAGNRPWLSLYDINVKEPPVVAVEEVGSGEDGEGDELEEEGQEQEEIPLVLLLPGSVVSSIFDLLGPVELCKAAQVCREWRNLAYQPALWRKICMDTWPKFALKENLNILLDRKYNSWRGMFLHRPRVRFDGIYILRHQYWKNETIIAYFRYFRFYADGTCVSLVSPDTPDKVQRRLRKEWVATAADSGKLVPSVGTFELDERLLNVEIRVPTFQPKYPHMRSQSMHYHLGLEESRPGARNKLRVLLQVGVCQGPGGVHAYNLDKFTQPFDFVPLVGFSRRCREKFMADTEYIRQARKMKVSTSNLAKNCGDLSPNLSSSSASAVFPMVLFAFPILSIPPLPPSTPPQKWFMQEVQRGRVHDDI